MKDGQIAHTPAPWKLDSRFPDMDGYKIRGGSLGCRKDADTPELRALYLSASGDVTTAYILPATWEPKAETVPADFFSPTEESHWLEVRFRPDQSGKPMWECCTYVVALFSEHFEVEERDGCKVGHVYSTSGNITAELMVRIRQKPGGRELPFLPARHAGIECGTGGDGRTV